MIYILESNDLSGLGGPMGSERITTNFVKYFYSIDNAKKYAEEDYFNYHAGKETIKWKKARYGGITSGDLLYVEYHIWKIKIEDEVRKCRNGKPKSA